MSYCLTPEDLTTISRPEMVFGTQRLLPAWQDLPDEFKKGNEYTRLVEALFYGRPISGCIQMKSGFDPEPLNRAVQAHLRCFGPKHEHKIAGVGYLIAQAAELDHADVQSQDSQAPQPPQA
jgi:hypothetical protein